MSVAWFKFYPADWRADPALRMCSIAARGLWLEMLCVMHEAEPRGHMLIKGMSVNARQLASLVGISLKEVTAGLAELEAAGVFSREGEVIFSRRMCRDTEKAERDKANGKGGGGSPLLKRGTVPKEERIQRRYRRSDSPEKTRRIFDRSAGRCHWCKEVLDPNHYHIDHVIAVRDGGNNDESNLVAACPSCNGERAVVWGRSDEEMLSDPNCVNVSDPKAQKLEARTPEPEEDRSSSVGNSPPREGLRFEAELRSALGERAPPEDGDFGPILALVASGYDPIRDILAACRAAAGKTTESVGSWQYYATAVARKPKPTPSEPMTWLPAESPRWGEMNVRSQREKKRPLIARGSTEASGIGAFIPEAWLS